jgi:hypothetical protein
MKLLYFLRVKYKLLKRKFMLVDSFCKECGRDVRDFVAPDEVWKRIESKIKYGNVLCYECFCDKCGEVGLLPVWKFEKID